MPIPPILADIIRLLIQILPAMALVCLVLAGISLRLEGGSTFAIGGGFTKWILWGVIMLTLPQLLLWFSFFGLPVPSSIIEAQRIEAGRWSQVQQETNRRHLEEGVLEAAVSDS